MSHCSNRFINSDLKSKIRHGSEPNNPLLINLWLSQTIAECPTKLTKKQLRQQYESQFRLLLDTIVDELVPSHWRRVCLDNIYIPLTSLQRISDNDKSQRHIRQLMAELNVSCQYVQHSL